MMLLLTSYPAYLPRSAYFAVAAVSCALAPQNHTITLAYTPLDARLQAASRCFRHGHQLDRPPTRHRTRPYAIRNRFKSID